MWSFKVLVLELDLLVELESRFESKRENVRRVLRQLEVIGEGLTEIVRVQFSVGDHWLLDSIDRSFALWMMIV